MFQNIPSLQPGTKIIVRQRANGDTEFICRADEGSWWPFFNGPDFGRILLTGIVAIILVFWFFWPSTSKGPRAGRPASWPANTEAVNNF